ncbi:hypothetical protein M0804_004545 [Polistes exclamans]|nr:hypothetical protein M0804_004545 [Polistes exclamans]
MLRDTKGQGRTVPPIQKVDQVLDLENTGRRSSGAVAKPTSLTSCRHFIYNAATIMPAGSYNGIVEGTPVLVTRAYLVLAYRGRTIGNADVSQPEKRREERVSQIEWAFGEEEENKKEKVEQEEEEEETEEEEEEEEEDEEEDEDEDEDEEEKKEERE